MKYTMLRGEDRFVHALRPFHIHGKACHTFGALARAGDGGSAMASHGGVHCRRCQLMHHEWHQYLSGRAHLKSDLNAAHVSALSHGIFYTLRCGASYGAEIADFLLQKWWPDNGSYPEPWGRPQLARQWLAQHDYQYVLAKLRGLDWPFREWLVRRERTPSRSRQPSMRELRTAAEGDFSALSRLLEPECLTWEEIAVAVVALPSPEPPGGPRFVQHARSCPRCTVLVEALLEIESGLAVPDDRRVIAGIARVHAWCALHDEIFPEIDRPGHGTAPISSFVPHYRHRLESVIR